MTVAIDHVFDRRIRDLLDFLDIGHSGRSPQTDGISSDYPIPGHDEHRLMTDVTEDVDILQPVDFGDGEKWRCLRARNERPYRSTADQREYLAPSQLAKIHSLLLTKVTEWIGKAQVRGLLSCDSDRVRTGLGQKRTKST
jgi:hypothetical protein